MAAPVSPLSSSAAAPAAPLVTVKDGRIHIGDKVFKAKVGGKDVTDAETLARIAKIINQHFEVQRLLTVARHDDKARTVKIVISTSKGMEVYHGDTLTSTIHVCEKVLFGKHKDSPAEAHFKNKMAKIQSAGRKAQAGPEAQVELEQQSVDPAPSLRQPPRKARGQS